MAIKENEDGYLTTVFLSMPYIVYNFNYETINSVVFLHNETSIFHRLFIWPDSLKENMLLL